MPFVWELQLTEGSSGWSAVYPHLQTQEDMEGGALKEEKVSAVVVSCLPVVKSRSLVCS